MSETNTVKGKTVDSLTNEEKTALTKQIEATIKNYKIMFVFACISIVIIIGIIIAPALYVALRKQQRRLVEIQQLKLDVYELTGILDRKNVSTKGHLYALFIDGQMLPGEVLTDGDKSGIKEYISKTVSIQYIPAISKNRLYKDAEGHGYNFITRMPLG